MYLSRLTMTNFRNFASLALDLPQGLVVLHGRNAQGKTALMEAMYLLAIGKSFRAENEREVVNWQAASSGEMAVVDGVAHNRGGRLRILIGYQPAMGENVAPGALQRGQGGVMVRRQIKVNGIARTISELVGQLNAVLFTAGDIEMVAGSPSIRRRYLDILISQVDRSYLRALQRYQHILLQRNRLLKLIHEGRAREEEITFWDDQMVKEGSVILRRRLEALVLLSTQARESHRDLTDGAEELSLDYAPSIPLPEDLEDLEQAFSRELDAALSKELSIGATTHGPHRDDLKLLVNGVDMHLYASRGQARTLALTLRLAEASYLAHVRREEPVLLLDDVLSELDSARRGQVLEKAQAHSQAILTTTDLSHLGQAVLASASRFQVEGGTVTAG